MQLRNDIYGEPSVPPAHADQLNRSKQTMLLAAAKRDGFDVGKNVLVGELCR